MERATQTYFPEVQGRIGSEECWETLPGGISNFNLRPTLFHFFTRRRPSTAVVQTELSHLPVQP